MRGRRSGPARHPPRHTRVSSQLALHFPGPPPPSPGTRRAGWPSVTFYASGTNDSGEIRGFANLGIHVGFSASVIGPAALRELERHARSGLLVFGDTGAYSEEVPGAHPQGTTTPGRTRTSRTREISPHDWEARLGVLERVARTFGDRFSVVAPDRVGDQEGTLARLQAHAPRIRLLARHGARVLLPLHAGHRALHDLFTEASAILGIPVVPAFPLPKDRTAAHDVLEFTRSARSRDVHLLGLGLRSRWTRQLLPLLARQVTGLHVSMDANLITSAVGRRSDGSAARALTAAQDQIRERGYPDAFGESTDPEWGIHADFTDSAALPSTWLGPSATRAVAAAAGLSPTQTARWKKDPDGFLQRRTSPHPDSPRWWQHPAMQTALEDAWVSHLHRLHTAPRKAEAIQTAFASHPAAGQFGSATERRAA